jgi:hypothetical protein
MLFENTRRFPKTIVTDQQASVIGALNTLAQSDDFPEFAHLLDQFHILRSVGNQLRSKSFDKEARILFHRMVYSNSKRKFKEYYDQLNEITD